MEKIIDIKMSIIANKVHLAGLDRNSQEAMMTERAIETLERELEFYEIFG